MMNGIMLNSAASGNWTGFLLLMISMVVLLKGSEYLYSRFFKKRPYVNDNGEIEYRRFGRRRVRIADTEEDTLA